MATTTAGVRTLLTHRVVPAGPIPTAFDPEGVYPYQSFCETAGRPELKSYTCVVLENAHIRVEILPGLGGKVQSMVEKRTGREALFAEPVVRPARILPRMAFISGGLECSFPISHTPSQIEAIGFQVRSGSDDCHDGGVDTSSSPGRAYVWCGETELRFGMQYTLEFSLGKDDAFLTQRVRFHNPTDAAHPWMSWSNAAAIARPDTELQFPSGPVLTHGSTVGELEDWATQGPKLQADIDSMTGYFWREPDVCAFGVFTPSVGTGIYHMADPTGGLDGAHPGIKFWTYGVGMDQRWSNASTMSDECYLEIQAGPIADQSIKAELEPGQTVVFQEYWFPTATKLDIRAMALPAPVLIPAAEIPMFGLVTTRPTTASWVALVASKTGAAAAALFPESSWMADNWAPSGMDELGPVLAGLVGSGELAAMPGLLSYMQFQLGAWHAGRGDASASLEALAKSADDRARALSGRLLRFVNDDAAAAAAEFAKIADPVFAAHPQVVIERDLALAALPDKHLGVRAAWLQKVSGLNDDGLTERRALLQHDSGDSVAALATLTTRQFQLLHQRYVRSDLYRCCAGLPRDAPVPASLGEDELARWGAYREHEEA